MQKRIVDALHQTLHEEMLRNDRLILIGEDIGVLGGAFGVTKGMLEEFGPERVFDAPISENAIIGASVGAAMTGLRPVAEIQFDDFLTCAMDPICNQAAKINFMLGGQTSVPLIIRTPIGSTGRGAQHSQCLEAWFMHTPGIKVIVPSTPYDAKGLLTTALNDKNPIIIFEHKMLYGIKGPEGAENDPVGLFRGAPDESYSIPFGEAVVRRTGKDITIVATSYMLHKSMEAAEKLSAMGIEVEIIDPRTLVPFDEDTVIRSVQKTGRLVVVTEDVARCGISAEISAIVAEKAFKYLKAPIKRICCNNTPVPFAPNCERHALPNTEKIIEMCVSLSKEENL